jgi:PTS system nitrogen regulatory IIA component
MRISTRAGTAAVDFDRLLAPECTVTNLIAASKKRALQGLADRLATRYPAFDADAVFEALMARERLGSTAVGEGVAIPHCRLAECEAPVAALAYLDAPVDFDAPDGRDVDLLFVLVVPEEAHSTHLELLAAAASALSDPAYRAALRTARDDVALFRSAIHHHDARGAAAG